MFLKELHVVLAEDRPDPLHADLFRWRPGFRLTGESLRSTGEIHSHRPGPDSSKTSACGIPAGRKHNEPGTPV